MRKFRDDQSGAMMMLIGILLLVAFLGLSAMVAKVQDAPLLAAAQNADPFAAEFEEVRNSLDRIADNLTSSGWTPGMNYLQSVESSFAYVAHHELQRGFAIKHQAACLGGQSLQITLEMQHVNTYARSVWSVAVPGQCL